jgi:phosphoglucomutase
MIGDKIRDKDAVSAVALLCEMTACEKEKGKKLFDKLIDLYVQYGLYKEDLISITKKGMNGAKEIADMMQTYRANPPKEINGVKVIQLLDYQNQTTVYLLSAKSMPITLPKSNVLQFILEDGTKISARPSGTEPKIKFYFSVNTKLDNATDFDAEDKELEDKIVAIIEVMGLKN